MELPEAYEALGLTPEASPEEVKSAYWRLSKEVAERHGPTGGHDEQVRINTAKDTIEEWSTSTALVPLKREMELIKRELASGRLHEQARERVEQIDSERRRPLELLRTTLLVLTGVSASLALMGNEIITTFLSDGITTQPIAINQVQRLLAAMTLLVGSAAGGTQYLLSMVEHSLQRWARAMSDPKKCAAELSELLKNVDGNTVSEGDLFSRHNVEWSIRSVLSTRGPDFLEVVVLKAAEHGLLRKVVTTELAPDAITVYDILFNHEKFRKSKNEKVPEPLKTMSIRGASLGLLLTTIGLGGLVMMAVYVTEKYGAWGSVPGLTALIVLGGFGHYFEEFKKAGGFKRLKKKAPDWW